MTEPSLPIQHYYHDDFSWCYGCGTNNASGHHFETRWDGEETVTEYLPRPEHTAIPGFVYGGLLASLVDCHSTGSAALALYRQEGHEPGDGAPVPRCVTASLHVEYLKPTPMGVRLQVRGRIEEISVKKAVVVSQVAAGEQVVATARVVAVRAPQTMTG
ncbi:PaaI family thioesterase [Sulfobacillus harzensis]|uniref:PaaI family thioesterase n=1 Tax=Sulfobacillus harzensis TaxID=2729629 RepID=A0A7Y0L5J9_9FIRM|nr:PaaI family thioesterase [Sulfobacillus harzensis]NMP22875.1 PaaI family thioesterase [Sulfobacillus harzensis]